MTTFRYTLTAGSERPGLSSTRGAQLVGHPDCGTNE